MITKYPKLRVTFSCHLERLKGIATSEVSKKNTFVASSGTTFRFSFPRQSYKKNSVKDILRDGWEFRRDYMERKNISVKLENCALSCNESYLQRYLQRYIKDIFLLTYKKSVPPQFFFKAIQSYFRTANPNQQLARVTKNTIP